MNKGGIQDQGGGGDKPMAPSDASRIQSGAAQQGGGGKGSFAARAQSVAARNVNNGNVQKK